MRQTEAIRLLGRALKERREAMGISPEDMNQSLPTPYSDLSSLRRIERGETRVDRDVLLAMLKTLCVIDEVGINQLLALGMWAPLTEYEADCICRPPMPQAVRWAVNDGKPAGVIMENDTRSSSFLPWSKLSREVGEKLLPQIFSLPGGSRVILMDHKREDGVILKDWLVRIVNSQNTIIAAMWFGGDPEKEWGIDGLVRIGPAKPAQARPHRVWEIYSRYSDGTYRKIRGVLGPMTYTIQDWLSENP